MTKLNLSKLLKPFVNKWVALSPDYRRVISSGDKLEEAAAKVKKQEKDKVVFFKVIPPYYVPSLL